LLLLHCGATQVPSQQICPAAQPTREQSAPIVISCGIEVSPIAGAFGGAHWPAEQTSPCAQAWPHAPQFWGSAALFAQVPPQQRRARSGSCHQVQSPFSWQSRP
jgi:hypothetical protein